VRLHRAAFVKLINSLQRTRRIVLPVLIDAAPGSPYEGVIFALDLRDVEWSDEVWRQTVVDYPYGIRWSNPARQKLHDAV